MRARWWIGFLSLGLSVTLSLGFAEKTSEAELQAGCAGSNCHVYQKGIVDLKGQENLKVKLLPRPEFQQQPLSAELLDSRGRIVDIQQRPGHQGLVLSAPEPGKYRVLVGSRTDQPLWDSLTVEVKPSVITLAPTRYGQATFDLFPAHPNPARGAALTRFVLPRESAVQLTLYTLAGREIRILFKGHLGEGFHQVRWETRDSFRRPLAEGSYLLELESGDKTVVKRVKVGN